jgi:hypothetical protein
VHEAYPEDAPQHQTKPGKPRRGGSKGKRRGKGRSSR